MNKIHRFQRNHLQTVLSIVLTTVLSGAESAPIMAAGLAAPSEVGGFAPSSAFRVASAGFIPQIQNILASPQESILTHGLSARDAMSLKQTIRALSGSSIDRMAAGAFEERLLMTPNSLSSAEAFQNAFAKAQQDMASVFAGQEERIRRDVLRGRLDAAHLENEYQILKKLAVSSAFYGKNVGVPAADAVGKMAWAARSDHGMEAARDVARDLTKKGFSDTPQFIPTREAVSGRETDTARHAQLLPASRTPDSSRRDVFVPMSVDNRARGAEARTPDGRFLVTQSGSDDVVRVFAKGQDDEFTDKPVAEYEYNGTVESVLVHPNAGFISMRGVGAKAETVFPFRPPRTVSERLREWKRSAQELLAQRWPSFQALWTNRLRTALGLPPAGLESYAAILSQFPSLKWQPVYAAGSGRPESFRVYTDPRKVLGIYKIEALEGKNGTDLLLAIGLPLEPELQARLRSDIETAQGDTAKIFPGFEVAAKPFDALGHMTLRLDAKFGAGNAAFFRRLRDLDGSVLMTVDNPGRGASARSADGRFLVTQSAAGLVRVLERKEQGAKARTIISAFKHRASIISIRVDEANDRLIVRDADGETSYPLYSPTVSQSFAPILSQFPGLNWRHERRGRDHLFTGAVAQANNLGIKTIRITIDANYGSELSLRVESPSREVAKVLLSDIEIAASDMRKTFPSFAVSAEQGWNSKVTTLYLRDIFAEINPAFYQLLLNQFKYGRTGPATRSDRSADETVAHPAHLPFARLASVENWLRIARHHQEIARRAPRGDVADRATDWIRTPQVENWIAENIHDAKLLDALQRYPETREYLEILSFFQGFQWTRGRRDGMSAIIGFGEGGFFGASQVLLIEGDDGNLDMAIEMIHPDETTAKTARAAITQASQEIKVLDPRFTVGMVKEYLGTGLKAAKRTTERARWPTTTLYLFGRFKPEHNLAFFMRLPRVSREIASP